MPVRPPTFDDYYDLAKSSALLLSERLLLESFSPGYMLDILAGLDAMTAEEVTRFALELHRQTFLRTASGEDLDALADDHYGLTRRQGSQAVGSVTFSRATTSAGPVFFEIGTRLATVDGTEFLTSDPLVLSGLSASVSVIAARTGTAGNVLVGTVTRIVSQSPDSTVSVSNSGAMAGGISRETDDAFRERVRGFLRTLRRGTVAAVTFGAMVEGVASAVVDESTDPMSVYIADSAGNSNDELMQRVRDELINWRAAGVKVNVFGATIVQQPITVSATFRAGINTSAARSALVSSLVAAVSRLTIGETLFRSVLIGAAQGVSGVISADISDPAGNVVPGTAELLRTAPELVTLA